jgi:hypothetical protein
MATEIEIERSVAAITATINDQGMDSVDAPRLQEVVDGATGGERKLTVDEGGGLHDESGKRVAAIRRTPSGEWIADRQNPEAHASDSAVPTPQEKGPVRKALTKLKPDG